MSATARAVGVTAALGAVACLGLAGAVPAYADTSYRPSLDASNWYWAGERPALAPAPAPAFPTDLPSQASGIPAGDVGVAYLNSTDKVTALQVGVASVPIGATFTSFVLTMHLDGTMESNGPAALSACELLDPFVDAPGPSSYAGVPTASSAACADGIYNAATTSYSFNLASVATDWAGGTPVSGLLIEPKAASTTPFNYAFDKKSITMTASYLAPVAAAPAVAPPAAPPPVTRVNPGIVSFPAPPVQSLPLVVTPAAPAPAPQTAPVPVTIAPAAATQVPFPVDQLRPDGAFWAGGVALALLLLTLSIVLGDPLAPVPVDPRRRRFADAVRARAAARAALTPAAPAVTRPTGHRARPA